LQRNQRGDDVMYALVPCAGSGLRAQAAGPKQYAYVAGRSLINHTLQALGQVQRIAQVVVVLSPDDAVFGQHAPGFNGGVAKVGGDSRAASVANGLQYLHERGAQPRDWVLVHDAARCLVRPQWVDALIDACLEDSVGGILALPVTDTLKRAEQGRVATTLERSQLWQAQTPQMFRLGMLQDALHHAGPGVTDEASAMEAAGHVPKLVLGYLENFKITYPSDLALAHRLLSSLQ
jgi:2-C-methyl-D-erythritol 4-phosphate cytidylyltransferase